MSRRFIPCTVTGPDGPLQAGDEVTGADVRSVVVQNGLVKVTYENHIPGTTEAGAHTLYRWHNDQWNRVNSTQYGDWFYFAIGVAVTADRCIVVRADPDVVELAFVWDSFSLASYSGGGVVFRDFDANVAYSELSSTPRRITSTKLTKTIKVVRGREGYFLGQHSWPMVAPEDALTFRNASDWGEREFGTGSGSYVVFSSAGFVGRHPEWGADARWAAAEAAVGAISNRTCWLGIADPSYAPWNNATVIATQNSGFPNYQSIGPWWVADLPAASVCPEPMCRYLAMVAPIETGSWQFGASAGGDLVAHFVNEYRDDLGTIHPYQVFFGAFPYTSASDITTEAGRANEPTTALEQKVANRCPLNFDDSGVAEDDGPIGTTARDIRDAMRSAVRALVPNLRADLKFRAYLEDGGDFRDYAERATSSVLRMFSIRDAGTGREPGAIGGDLELVERDWELVVAYPKAAAGEAGVRGALSLEDMMESDARQLKATVGTAGFQTLGLSQACVINDAPRISALAACTYMVIPLRVTFWRQMT